MGRITASRKQLTPDPKFNSLLASKFINALMWDGKKTIAQKLFYSALEEIGNRLNDAEPIEVFNQAVENVKPQIEVRSKRVGGAAYQVPMQVNRNRQQALAFRTLVVDVALRPRAILGAQHEFDLLRAHLFRGQGSVELIICDVAALFCLCDQFLYRRISRIQ